MEKCYNSDLIVGGKKVHIQTEDWGAHNPYIVTTVFSGGSVLKSHKTSYSEVAPLGVPTDVQAIRLATKTQHYKILDGLVSGQLSL